MFFWSHLNGYNLLILLVNVEIYNGLLSKCAFYLYMDSALHCSSVYVTKPFSLPVFTHFVSDMSVLVPVGEMVVKLIKESNREVKKNIYIYSHNIILGEIIKHSKD